MWILRPRHPVDEAHGQVEAGRIADDRGELAGHGALGGGLLERRGRDPSFGESDRVVDQRHDVVGSRGRDPRRRICHGRDQLAVKRRTKARAVSATSRHPLSIVSACPRLGISTISVTPVLRFCFL